MEEKQETQMKQLREENQKKLSELKKKHRGDNAMAIPEVEEDKLDGDHEGEVPPIPQQIHDD